MTSPSTIGPTLFEALEPRLLLSTTIFSEGFENGLNQWTTNISQGRQWGEAMSMSHGGWYSAHCGVTQYGTETNNYVNNMLTTLSRTVSLDAYSEATLSFWYWMNAEYGYDGLIVKANGTTIGSDNQGATGGWLQVALPLDAYCGLNSVTLEFQFYANYAGVPMGYSGVWLDDVAVTATQAGPPPDGDDSLGEATVEMSIPFQEIASIDPETDVDMYVVPADAGDRVSFDIDRRSDDLDAYLRLFDALGNELAFNDNGQAPGEPASSDAYVEYTFTTTDWYTVAVSAAGNTAYDPLTGDGDTPGGSTGEYRLEVQVAPDGADLSLADIGLEVSDDDPLLPGEDEVRLTYMIWNHGPATVYDETYVIDIYLSTDAVITTADTKIGEYDLSFVWDFTSGQYASGNVTADLSVPAALAPGTYHVGGHLRPTGVLSDPNDGNNWRAGDAVLLTCPGDADSDGDVDLDDFVLLKQNFGTFFASWAMGDFDDDGDVDLDDFVLLKQNFGTAADPAPVARADNLLAEPVESPARHIRRRLGRRARRDAGTDTAGLDLLRTARLVVPL
ncbi:MAG: pre-peptidase C-terminal domain-containing protein [Planctomycetota bacterium]